MKKLLLILMLVSVVSGNTKMTIGNSFKPRYSAEEILISNFDGGVGTEWVKTAGLTAVDDIEFVRNGTKSIRLETDYESTTSTTIKKTFSSTSFDTIDYFVLSFHIDDSLKLGSDSYNVLGFRISTNTNDNYYKEFNLQYANVFNDGWYKIPFHKGSFTKNNAADWANITSITLVLKNVANKRCEIVLDQLSVVKSPVKGGIVFWFDATASGMYDYARPIFDRYGFKFTASVKAKYIGGGGGMTLQQLKQLQSEGHDLVSYPWESTSLTTLTPNEVDTQLTKIKTYMVDNGFPNWKFLAFSQTAHNRLVDSIAFSKGFEWFRGSQTYTVGGTTILQTPPYSNRCFGQYVYYTQDIGTLTGIVDTAIKYNTVIPMLFHGVRTYDSSSIIDTTKLVALLDYCETKLGSGELGYAGKVTNYFSGPPVITVQPRDTTVNDGSTVSFSVTATNATGYQWYGNGELIPGATNSVYSFTATLALSGSSIYCIVYNAADTVWSDTATLTVNVLPKTPANITVEPVSDTVTAGQSATFFVTASGSGLVYQWYRNDSLIAGATNDTFTYTARSQVGNYTDNIYCLLTTDTTISTDTVNLLVNGIVFRQSVDTLKLVCSNNHNIGTWQWYQNNVAISGATDSVLSVVVDSTSATKSVYYCEISNGTENKKVGDWTIERKANSRTVSRKNKYKSK